MKIIHTSDWHLGQKLLYNDREEEHRLALDWLLQAIECACGGRGRRSPC